MTAPLVADQVTVEFRFQGHLVRATASDVFVVDGTDPARGIAPLLLTPEGGQWVWTPVLSDPRAEVAR